MAIVCGLRVGCAGCGGLRKHRRVLLGHMIKLVHCSVDFRRPRGLRVRRDGNLANAAVGIADRSFKRFSRPAAPARAASTPVFRARRLALKAISSITSMILEILPELSSISLIASIASRTIAPLALLEATIRSASKPGQRSRKAFS